MKRTSVVLPETLLQQSSIISSQGEKTVSELIREILQKEISKIKDEKVESMYKAVNKMVGKIDVKEENISSEINDLLYGENGAWKGSDD